MEPIRVHFGPMPAMLRAIISDLLCDARDIEIVGKSEQRTDCLKEARQGQASVVIAQESGKSEDTCLDLILADPPLGVLSVSRDGQSASGVTLARRPLKLETGSPSALANAIRQLAEGLHSPAFEAAGGGAGRSTGPGSDPPIATPTRSSGDTP